MDGGGATAKAQAGLSQFKCLGSSCRHAKAFDLFTTGLSMTAARPHFWGVQTGRVLGADQQGRQLDAFEGIFRDAVGTQTHGADIT